MFNTLKRELNIVDVISYVTETEYKLVGENTYIPEDDVCPVCQHNNCFRIKHEGSNEDSFAKCFSESKVWDVISIVAELKEISNVEAAKLLSKHYSIELPHDYSPVQEVMNLAANYYHELLYTAGPCAELGGLTPEEYQLQVRRHTKESLTLFQIGWSDGKLIPYLESVGISKEMILESGLSGKKGLDFFPNKVFMYPHMVRGRTSHFTFKDVLKQKEFQLQNKYRLNGCMYYNSDSISKAGPISIVEGENDCISISEAGWDSGILCCNGSISSAQLEWLSINAKGRDVVTFFDQDPAGNTYREKLDKMKNAFNSLTQVMVTGQCKDIDEYLKKGGDLAALLENTKPTPKTSILETEGVESDGTEPSESSPIVVKNGAYHRVVYKDGNETLRQITNFTMQLLNVYIRGDEREREVMFTLQNGSKSKPVIVSSDAKTSLKAYKTIVANAIDASFYGTEADLTAVWEKVFATSKAREVHLLDRVGRIDDFHGWIFKDCFIADSGAIYEPDETGVMWITSNTVGIKPISIISGGAANTSQAGVPCIKSELDQSERKAMIKAVLDALSANLGDRGEALTILGWCWATIYSKMIHEETTFFPMLQFWGLSGKGKTWLIKMFLDIFNMDGPGYTGINGLNSGVAFSRKLAYYVSLPMCIDEIRNDDVTAEWYGTFREWYNRNGRAISAKEGNGIKIYPVLSTIIFGGEDQFSDPATRQRSISVRVRKNNREMVKSFKVLDDNRSSIHAIGYEWILGYKNITKPKLMEEFSIFEKFLKKNNVDERQARNWAVVGIFANKLCKEYCPEYNYMENLVKVASTTQREQKEDTTLVQFWQIIEGMQVAERPVITTDHLKRVGDELFVWFADVYRLFEKDGNHANRQKFSKNALLAALREEDGYVRESREQLGMAGNWRRCVVLKISESNEVVQAIAKFLDN